MQVIIENLVVFWCVQTSCCFLFQKYVHLRQLFPELRKGLLVEAHTGADHLSKEHLDLQQKCVDRGSTTINTWINFRDWQDWQDLKVKDWKSKGMVRFGGWKDWKGQGIRKDHSEKPDETSSHLVIDSWNKRLAICQHLPCSWPPYRSHPQELIFYTFLPPNLPKNHLQAANEAVTN